MDPLHVHVGKETPIHLHVTDGKKKLSAKAAKISKSFSEMSAGRPSLRAQESLNKPTRLTWNSPTHTLQIQTPNRLSIRTPDGAGPGLELSELTGSGGVKGKTTELILETPEAGRTQEQLIDAKNRIIELESEVELERTIRRVEKRDKLGGGLSGLDLADTSYKMAKQDSNLIRQQTRDGLDSIRYLQERREDILRKLLETELLSADSSKLSDKLRRIVQRVEREKSANGSYGQGVAQDLTELRDELLKTLVEFDSCNAALRRMLRDQHEEEGRVKQALTQQELLLSRLKGAEDNFTNQIRENELLNSDLRSAKNSLRSVDRQFEANSDNIKRMEIQLNESHREVEKLREILLANERMGDDSMRTFRIKEDELTNKLNSSELEINSIRGTLKTIQTQCDTAQQAREKLSRDVRHKNEEVSRLNEQIIEYQNKHSQLVRGKAQVETDCSLYRDKVAEVEATLFQSKDTAKTSLDSLSKRLLETTQDLNTSQIDKQRLEARVAGLQDRLSQQEQMADTRAQSANSEATQLQTSIGHFEALIIEYKGQIDELKRDNLTLHSELTTKDGSLERLRDDQRNSVELEKIRFQTKVAEMEPLPELIREKDSQILGLREKVNSLEDILSKQTLTLTDFSDREKGHLTLNDNTRERLFHVSGENKVFQDRVSELERRVTECDQQNRDLISISSKKEEALQRVQTRLEEVTNENINLSRQFESSRTDSRRQVEQMREKLSLRDRTLHSNVADLEAQVAQLGVTNSQLKRNKDDAERRYTTRIAEMKDKLEQANSSAKSMQSYIQFLKTSYATVFHDPTDKPISY